MFLDFILHGGHLSCFFAQLVKTPFFIIVISPFLLEETPYIRGSFLLTSKIFFLTKILVSLARKFLFSKLNIPSLNL